MKIAVACMGDQIAEHFGHCENFRVYDIIDDVIASQSNIPNPGHKPGFLPNFLADKGINVIIVGGIGGGAIEIFDSRDIKVVSGAAGDSLAAVNAYCLGRLQNSGAICHEHQHSNECGE